MSISGRSSLIFSHIKKESNGDSVILSFLDFFTLDTSDVSLFENPQVKLLFKVKALTQFGSEIQVSGNIKELGNWNTNDSLSLHTNYEIYPIWVSSPVTISINSFPFRFEYKYILVNNNTKTVKWETFHINRVAVIKERCSFWNSFEIINEFNSVSSVEVSLKSKNPVVNTIIQNFTQMDFDENLNYYAGLIESSVVDLTLIHLIAVSLRALTELIKENRSLFYSFIFRCMKKLNIQQTRMILYFIYIPNIELNRPSGSLVDYADICENSIENLDEDIIVTFNLSTLRSSIYQECRSFKNSVALMLTDNNLEQKQIELIEKILENLEEKESIWKITLIGKWMSEMLFYHCIRNKQMSVMKSQFERLEKSENLEVLKDLIYELMHLVIEEYHEISTKVSHLDNEVLAKGLNSDYALIYYNLFLLASKYILRSIPIVNKGMSIPPYVCYSQGAVKGLLSTYNDSKSNSKTLLLISKPDEYLELSENVVGILVGSTQHLLVNILVTAKFLKIPVVIGFLPLIDSQEHVLTATEDFCSLSK